MNDSIPNPAKLGTLGHIGKWCAKHATLVIVSWVIILLATAVVHKHIGSTYSDNFSLPNTSAQDAANLLKKHDPTAGGQSGQLVFTVDNGTLQTHQAVIQTAIANTKALPHVLSIGNPLLPATTSSDDTVAYTTVHFNVNPGTLGVSYIDQFNSATDVSRNSGVNVHYGGTLGVAAQPKAKDIRSEFIGIVVAIVVLLLMFGSIYAAGLPILSAVLGAITGLSVIGIAASAVTLGTVSPTLGVMMGLGVGIDYALFITTRHRQQVMNGVDPIEAAARTMDASGHAVMIAATTVIIAMLGLYASGLSFIGSLGLAGAIAVAVSAVCAMTLVPALLGKAGRSIDKLKIRKPVAEVSKTNGGWQRYVRSIGMHPWVYLITGVAIIAVLAIPMFSLQLGHIDAGAEPNNFSDKQAYDAIGRGFGTGANGQFTVVVALQPSQVNNKHHTEQVAQALRNALQRTADVASVSPVKPTTDGALLIANVIPRSDPQSASTDALMDMLTSKTLPRALNEYQAHGYVSGSTAANLQFRDKISSRLPLIIGLILLAAFLLLLITFRAPVMALKAAILNLLSIGAAYGVIVAVFQWGWGSSWLGVSEKVPIESYIPMILFAIVFGLSMDYEVFLLSRIREEWDATYDNHASVAAGLSATGRVISCAALIMASVFFAFVLTTNVVVKMLALGLGVSVLIDATIIRLALVPATMFLLGGRINWWAPKWFNTARKDIAHRQAIDN
jgi:RND superfamily putative drug exporter